MGNIQFKYRLCSVWSESCMNAENLKPDLQWQCSHLILLYAYMQSTKVDSLLFFILDNYPFSHTHAQLCKDARLLPGRTRRPYRKLLVINPVTFIIGIM